MKLLDLVRIRRGLLASVVFAALIHIPGATLSLAQTASPFGVGDRVEADVNMASSPEYQKWLPGTVTEISMWQGTVAGIFVQLDDSYVHTTSAQYLRALAEEPPAETTTTEATGGSAAVGATTKGGATAASAGISTGTGTGTGAGAGMSRTTAATQARNAAPSGPVQPGSYTCWAANGTAGMLRLVIRNGSQYSNDKGSAGTYQYDAASGQLTFQSGPWEGFYGTNLGPGKLGLSSRPGGSPNTLCDRQ